MAFTKLYPVARAVACTDRQLANCINTDSRITAPLFWSCQGINFEIVRWHVSSITAAMHPAGALTIGKIGKNARRSPGF